MRKNGYTLIEVLLTTLIFSVIIASVYSVFQTGNIAYTKIDSAFELYQKARIIFSRIERDLKNSFAYSMKKAEFWGARNEINFFTVFNSFNQKAESFREISRIKYRFQDTMLSRTQLTGLDALRPDVPQIPLELSDDLQDIFFQFASLDPANSENYYSWQDTWPKVSDQQDTNQEKSLPLAVKVEMIIDGLKFIKIIPLEQSYFQNES
jgi:prepilin-type N-terminal cleavage/methylation domain-containing protein